MIFNKKDGTNSVFIVKKATINQTASGLKYTRFSISQKKGMNYEYCNVFVWEELPLQDGDRIIIKSIDAISTNLYTNRMNSRSVALNIYAKIEVVGLSSDHPVDVQGDMIPDFSETSMPF